MLSNDEKIPKQVTNACYLMWCNIFLGVILSIMDAGFESLLNRTYLIVIAIYVFLIFFVSKGKRFARFLFLGLSLLHLCFVKLSLEYYVSVSGIIELIQLGTMILSLYLVYSAPGNAWFFSRKQTTENVRAKE